MDIEAKHRALDSEIQQEQKRHLPNLDKIASLKKEKLALRDQIYHH